MPEAAYVQWLVPMEHLHVAPEVVGRTFPIGTVEGVHIEISFPTIEQGYLRVVRGTADDPQLLELRELWVHAYLTAPVGGQPGIDEARQPTQAEIDEAQELFREARIAVARALDVMLGFNAHERKELLARLREPLSELMPRLYVGAPPRHAKTTQAVVLNAILAPPRPGLSAAQLQGVEAAIASGADADLGWQLLARAYRELILDSDHRQSILEGAIAVEVALDAAYRRKWSAHPDVIKFVLKRVGSLEDQLKEGAKAFLGANYAEVDKASYEGVVALSRRRNDIVHNGAAAEVTSDELRKMLTSAKALLEWIETI